MTENERLTNSDKEIPTLNDNAEYWLQVYFKLKDYEAIGTIDEFKALKEKNVAKKPYQDKHLQHTYFCSCCGYTLAESVADDCCLEEEMAGWCPNCGQKLDWSE